MKRVYPPAFCLALAQVVHSVRNGGKNLGGLGLEDVGKGPKVLLNIRAEASGPVYGPGCFGGLSC